MEILEHNLYAKFSRNLCQVSDLDTYHIVLRVIPGINQRVYNKTTVFQVAALWVEGQENRETNRRDIRVYTHGSHSKSIEYYYGCYDPLQYPLMFPFVELSWHGGIPKKERKTKEQKKGKEGKMTKILFSLTMLLILMTF